MYLLLISREIAVGLKAKMNSKLFKCDRIPRSTYEGWVRDKF